MQTVRFVSLQQLHSTRYFTDQYSFRKDKKWHRLQRFCFWCLKKIGAYAYYDDTKFEYNTVAYDPYKIEDYIRNQWREQKRLYNTNPKYLLMGRDQFYDFTRSTLDYPLRFSLHGEYNDSLSVNEYMGMEIIVIPWLDGAIVLPDI